MTEAYQMGNKWHCKKCQKFLGIGDVAEKCPDCKPEEVKSEDVIDRTTFPPIMTLREHYAGLMMAKMVANFAGSYEAVAKAALEAADALIAAEKKDLNPDEDEGKYGMGTQ